MISTKPSASKRHRKLIGILAVSAFLLLVAYLAWRSTHRANSKVTPGVDLTPEVVSTMVRGPLTKDVEARLPKAVTSFGHFGTYEDMRRAKVLDCAVSMFGKYLDCKPGPKGELFKLNGSDLTLLIGRKTPSVTGISQIDPTSALADVILVFEPLQGYEMFQRWEQAFYKPPIQTEKHTVHLRRYDDGWRIEKVD